MKTLAAVTALAFLAALALAADPASQPASQAKRQTTKSYRLVFRPTGKLVSMEPISFSISPAGVSYYEAYRIVAKMDDGNLSSPKWPKFALAGPVSEVYCIWDRIPAGMYRAKSYKAEYPPGNPLTVNNATINSIEQKGTILYLHFDRTPEPGMRIDPNERARMKADAEARLARITPRTQPAR